MWPSEISNVLQPILTEALKMSRCERGNIQVLDVATGCLSIEAHHGFDDAFLSTFKTVKAENGCACGRAIRSRMPVLITDVESDGEYTPYRQAAANAGYRSVASLPLIDSEDTLVGVISVHRPTPWTGEFNITALGDVAEFAAEAIIRHRSGA
jgi:GAF domain-containing protein